MSSLRTLAAFALIAASSSSVAHADTSRAWSAAKASLPADTSVVIGIGVASITKSAVFTKVFPQLLTRAPDVQAGLDAIKAACKLDPLVAIQSVVIGTNADQTAGAVFVGLNGVDQAKLTACVETGKGTVVKDGNVLKVTFDKDTMYLAWVTPAVFAFALSTDDKAQLQTWTSGKGSFARGAAGKLVGKTTTGAAAWAVTTVPKTVQDGFDLKRGYGAVTVRGGNLGVDLHIGVASTTSATEIADKATKELADNAASMTGDIKALISAVHVTATSDEVIVKATLPEKQLLPLLGLLLH